MSISWAVGLNWWFSFTPVFQLNDLTTQRSPNLNTLFLSSPHLYFTIGFTCDLSVARNDAWMT